MRADPHLRHGYHLSHADTLARQAYMGYRSHWSGGRLVDQIDTARHAIITALYGADTTPDPLDLIRAAQRALRAAKEADMRTHGIPVSARGTGRGYAVYWWTGVQSGPEERAVETLAMRQIIPTLPRGQQDALLALAAAGTYEQAAALLGITPVAFQIRISRARTGFRALWHEGETPSRQWGRDRRGGSATAMDRLHRRARTRQATAS